MTAPAFSYEYIALSGVKVLAPYSQEGPGAEGTLDESRLGI
jgi:hypothetical protein